MKKKLNKAIFLSLVALFPYKAKAYEFYFIMKPNITYHLFNTGIQNSEGNPLKKQTQATFEQAYDALLRVINVDKDGTGFLRGEYHTSFRLFGTNDAYKAQEEHLYESNFSRNKWGDTKSDSKKDVYPSIRSVPHFSSQDVPLKGRWNNEGFEVQDFSVLGYKDPFIVPFKAQYQYAMDLDIERKEFEKLKERYRKYNYQIDKELTHLSDTQGKEKKDQSQIMHLAIIFVQYNVDYKKEENKEQTQAILKIKKVPVDTAKGYYKGIVFWDKATRDEIFSVGEYNFIYRWDNGTFNHWDGKENGSIEVMVQDEKKIDKLAQKARNSLDKTIEVERKKEGINLILSDLLFNFNKADLKPGVLSSLKKVVDLLKENPTAIIKIEGHSDDIGTSMAKEKISTDRAHSVARYLIDQGIKTERITYQGKSDKAPRVPNTSSANRKKNRRVELHIVTQ
jgi:outer membrane protein OmpA-like peptidoglycan-associated protein